MFPSSRPSVTGQPACIGVHCRGPRALRAGPVMSIINQVIIAVQTAGALLSRVQAAAAHWSRHRLSYIGRAYVAKQVLAATLVYFVGFVAMPSHVWSCIRGVLARIGHRCSRCQKSLGRDPRWARPYSSRGDLDFIGGNRMPSQPGRLRLLRIFRRRRK